MTTCNMETIGPSEAQLLLKANTSNRSVRSAAVSAYAADMAAGRWLNNGETIKIACDGTLVDGQHRLLAVIESGVAISTLVARDVSMDTQLTVDTGRRRSFADFLSLRGEKDSTAVAAVVLRAYRWDQGARGPSLLAGVGMTPPTHLQLFEYLERNPGIRDAAMAGRECKGVPIAASILGLLAWRAMQLPDAEEDLAFFLDRLNSGANLDVDHPIATLRKTAMGNALDRTSNVGQAVMCAYVIKAWNYYREGKPLSRLVFKAGGSKPEKFPEPK